jgi:hypothetical protein
VSIDRSTEYFCDACGLVVAGADAKEMRLGTSSMAVCATCGRALERQAGRVVARAGETPGASFARALVGAFAYPWRPSFVAIALVLTVFDLVVRVGMGMNPITGLVGVSAKLALLFHVVRITAEGQDEWSLGTDEGDTLLEWLRPLARFVIATAVAFGPAVAVGVGTGSPALAGIVAVGGLVYLPAALVIASYQNFGCLGAVNPLPALALIARIPGSYAVTLGFLLGAVALSIGVSLGGDALAGALTRAPLGGFVAGLLGSVAQLLVAMIAARMLGLLVREHAEEIFGG